MTVQIFANDKAELMRENKRLREENLRLTRENEALRTAAGARAATIPRASAPPPRVAATAIGARPALPAATPARSEPPAKPVDLDDSATRFGLLELD